MFSRFKPFGKVPPTMLAPGLPEEAQKGELYESAALAMRAYRSRNVLRRRTLSDDPEMAAIPIGCREGVLVSSIGRVRVTDQGVQPDNHRQLSVVLNRNGEGDYLERETICTAGRVAEAVDDEQVDALAERLTRLDRHINALEYPHGTVH